MATRIEIEEQMIHLVATARRYNPKDPRYLTAHALIDRALALWERMMLEELVAHQDR